MTTGRARLLLAVGRVAVASLFVLGSLSKLADYAGTADRMAEASVAPALLPAVIALELGGGAAVAIGRRGAALAALALVGHVALVNLLFHPFWSVAGPMRAVEVSLFFKNVAVAGSLLLIAGLASLPPTRDEDSSHA